MPGPERLKPYSGGIQARAFRTILMRRTAFLLAAAILGLTVPASAFAQGAPRDPFAAFQAPRPEAARPQAPARPAAPRISRAEAVSLVSRVAPPGKHLDVQYDESRGVYRVQWAADSGRRLDFTVDAQTGAVRGG